MTAPVVPPVVLDDASLTAIREMTGDDPEFIAELSDTFVTDTTTLLDQMTTAAANGDAPALRRAAHTAKSNARTFGATALAQTCQQVEEIAAGGQVEGTEPLISRAEREFPLVVEALTIWRASI